LAREGITVRGRFMRMRYAADDGGPRVAYAIPRRAGTAVARNRVRRQCRAALDEVARHRGGLPSGAYLIQVPSTEWKYSEILREFEQMFDKAASR
jgi:ribonuclease P protein component